MRTIHRPIVWGVVVLLCVGMWSLRHGARPIGVVIITLDTTRADRLSPYGFMDAPMPALDRLAREGIVFDRATSVAPLTLPAHSSLFTGLTASSECRSLYGRRVSHLDVFVSWCG